VTERTFAMIKPDGRPQEEAIRANIREAGFNLIVEKELTLNPQQVAEFYSEHSSRPFFADLLDHMTSGPVLVMVLEREGAIKQWRELMGPTDPLRACEIAPKTIRAKYWNGNPLPENVVHGSDSLQAAEREINFFFPELTEINTTEWIDA
jgi:nucleoside diphosphate kinase